MVFIHIFLYVVSFVYRSNSTKNSPSTNWTGDIVVFFFLIKSLQQR